MAIVAMGMSDLSCNLGGELLYSPHLESPHPHAFQFHPVPVHRRSPSPTHRPPVRGRIAVSILDFVTAMAFAREALCHRAITTARHTRKLQLDPGRQLWHDAHRVVYSSSGDSPIA